MGLWDKKFLCCSHFILIPILLILFNSSGLAQRSQWATGVGEASLANITYEQARMNALRAARLDAVQKVVGYRVYGGLLDMYVESNETRRQEKLRDLFATISFETSYGYVVKDSIISKGIVPGKEIYQVSLKAKVVIPEGEPDPNFHLELDLNRNLYQEGDKVFVSMRSTKECYVTLFDILPSDSVLVLIPNAMVKDNHLMPGVIYTFPPEYYDFEATIPSGRKRSLETLLAIATRDAIAFGRIDSNLETYPMIPTYKTAVIELMKWLCQIPPDKRTQAHEVIEIRSRN